MTLDASLINFGDKLVFRNGGVSEVTSEFPLWEEFNDHGECFISNEFDIIQVIPAAKPVESKADALIQKIYDAIKQHVESK